MKPRGYWTPERIREVALKYKTRAEFNRHASSAYQIACRMGIVNDVCSHMVKSPSKKKYWTAEKCRDAALTCQSRIEFNKKFSGAIKSAKELGIYEDICKHMETPSNGYKMCVYVIRNDRLNKAYIGVTCKKFHKRANEHKSPTNRCNSKEISFLDDTVFEKLTDHIFTAEDVKEFAEQDFINRYEAKGYEVLNSQHAVGSVGYKELLWTPEAIWEEALKHTTMTSFIRQASGAYNAASKDEQLLKKVTAHMVSPQKPKGYWTKKRCATEASRHKSRDSFAKESMSAYQIARKNDWLDDFFPESANKTKPHGYWEIKENCIKEAKKYPNRTAFLEGSAGAFYGAKRNNWLEELFPIENPNLPREHWQDKEVCRSEANKFKSRYSFRKGCQGGYSAAWKNGWLDEFFPESSNRKKPGYWNNKENCAKEAEKYESTGAFRKGSAIAYKSAQEKGWLREFFPNMRKSPRSRTGDDKS